ncbi:MAG: hypothetical protein H0T57_15035 [Rubrobacter sp.]|nr:hypothetical protein [Rubrobacter sp.]
MRLRVFSRPRLVGSLGSFATGRTAAKWRPSGRGISHGGVGESVPRLLGSSFMLLEAELRELELLKESQLV